MHDKAAAAVWTDPDAPALCLIALALDRYLPRDRKGGVIDDEVSPVNWSPHTWAAEIEDDCGVPPHPRAMDRLCAALSLLHSPDEFYRTPQGFLAVVEGLAGDWFDPNLAHPPTAAELARAVIEAHMIAPPDRVTRFDQSVSRLIQICCREEGYPRLPPLFESFGVRPDSSIEAGSDLSGDLDISLAVAQSRDDLEGDFEAHVRDWMVDLANRVAALPLKHSDPKPLAAELASHADRP